MNADKLARRRRVVRTVDRQTNARRRPTRCADREQLQRSSASVARDKTFAGSTTDVVPEIRSLGATLARWRTEILAHHTTGASNGPTEGLNLLVKEVKRCGRGFENFEHYRLRVLLRAGKPAWPNKPTPPILRTGRPHAHA